MHRWENDTHKALEEVDWGPYWSINDTMSNTQAVIDSTLPVQTHTEENNFVSSCLL